MKRYINPQMDLLILNAQDIVRTSNQDPEQSIGVTYSTNSNDITDWRLGSVINN